MSSKTHFFEDMKLGQKAEISRSFSDADVRGFADLSGDHNPVHLDEDYAKTTRFHGRIVHGMLVASLFSDLLGEHLPGPGAIYLSQTLKFTAPVHLDDQINAEIAVKALDAKHAFVVFDCIARVGETVVLTGEAMVMAPRKPG